MTASKLFRVESFVQGLAIKAPCRAVTTGPITLNGLQTINTYVGQEGDRILVKDQLDPVENGIYTMEQSDWKRDGDFDGNRDVVGGTLVPAYDHAAGEIIQYAVIGEPARVNPGTDSITFEVFFQQSVGPGGDLELASGGCVIWYTPDNLDNVQACMNDSEQAYPFLEFIATANCEIYRFDEGIWTLGDLHIGGAGTRRLAFYGYGDAVSGSIAQDASNNIDVTCLGIFTVNPATNMTVEGPLIVDQGSALTLRNVSDTFSMTNNGTDVVISKVGIDELYLDDMLHFHVDDDAEIRIGTSPLDQGRIYFDSVGGNVTFDHNGTGAFRFERSIGMQDNTISRAELDDFRIEHQILTSTSGSLDWDYPSGQSAFLDLTENITTWTFTDPPISGTLGQLELELTQDATVAYTITWPASVQWPGGSAPDLSTLASRHVIHFRTINAGTTWLATHVGEFS